MPASIRDYLARVDALLEGALGALGPEAHAVVTVGDDYGTFRGVIRLDDGFQLSVRLTVDARRGEPERVDYSYHCQDASGATILRYDNTPHHPQLHTFPHHRHVGSAETPEPAWEPSLHDLIREIQALRAVNEP